ncbi:hypothetical protein [Singulisphaera sp. PoT]|uniref:hypothetical protein n=1 Tax=Singulisphaera sp. PoT TaxID=3411797 RepID=UPI003BF4CB97
MANSTQNSACAAPTEDSKKPLRYGTCDLREKPAEILDRVTFDDRTVLVHSGRRYDGYVPGPPVAVILPYAEYAKLKEFKAFVSKLLEEIATAAQS